MPHLTRSAPLDPRICILGAGPSGLAMARRLLEAGLRNFVVYDRQHQPGGNWTDNDPSGHLGVYEGVRSISSKRCTAFPGYAFPGHVPDYPSRHDLLTYLKSFASTLNLAPHLRLGTEVRAVTRARSDSNEVWKVTLHGGESSMFDAVCVCNGHHTVPLFPEIEGRFSGRLLHAHEFRTSFPFTGQRVLVLGGGNSAADIAADLARRSGTVTLSLRRGYHLLPRHIFGIPSDELHSLLHWLPRSLLGLVAPMLFRLAHGPAMRHLPRPDHPLFATHPLIHAELPRLIASGAIRLQGPIRKAQDRSITFADGSTGEFDLLIACTGYQVSLTFLDLPPNLLPPRAELPLHIFHPRFPGLYFLGLIQPNGSIWPLADLQARLVAKHLREGLPAPTSAPADYRTGYVNSPRHLLEVDFFRYRRALRRELKQTP